MLHLPAIRYPHIDGTRPTQTQYDPNHTSLINLKTSFLSFIPDVCYPVTQDGRLTESFNSFFFSLY